VAILSRCSAQGNLRPGERGASRLMESSMEFVTPIHPPEPIGGPISRLTPAARRWESMVTMRNGCQDTEGSF
jgi:hypothetical protein